MVTESDVGGDRDVRHLWVIEVDLSVAEARELGGILGKHGFTGKFIDGDIAGLARDGAKWRRLQKGGDNDGELDKALSQRR